MVVRLTRSAIAAGRRRRATECVVKIPADISALTVIRGVQRDIAKLMQQGHARAENPGRARGLARDLFKMQQDFQCRFGRWPY
jgi:hypothetical protein